MTALISCGRTSVREAMIEVRLRSRVLRLRDGSFSLASLSKVIGRWHMSARTARLELNCQ